MRWGLIPFWAKNHSIGSSMINARAETVAEKPSFRDSFRRRRCLVLADGFYEWQRTASPASAPCASPCGRENRSPSRVYGLCGRIPRVTRYPRAPSSRRQQTSCSGPATIACPLSCPATWRGSGSIGALKTRTELRSVLTPYPDAAMEAYEVSTLVNSVANDGPDLIARVA